MEKTLYDLLPKDVKDWWDGYDYYVLSPQSLDDAAEVEVVLRRKFGEELKVKLSVVYPHRR